LQKTFACEFSLGAESLKKIYLNTKHLQEYRRAVFVLGLQVSSLTGLAG
jgi:hypothetical protein